MNMKRWMMAAGTLALAGVWLTGCKPAAETRSAEGTKPAAASAC
jgi:hypothetical protein